MNIIVELAVDIAVDIVSCHTVELVVRLACRGSRHGIATRGVPRDLAVAVKTLMLCRGARHHMPW